MREALAALEADLSGLAPRLDPPHANYAAGLIARAQEARRGVSPARAPQPADPADRAAALTSARGLIASLTTLARHEARYRSARAAREARGVPALRRPTAARVARVPLSPGSSRAVAEPGQPRPCGWGGAPGDPAPCPDPARPHGYLCPRHAAIVGRLAPATAPARRSPRREPAPVTVRYVEPAPPHPCDYPDCDEPRASRRGNAKWCELHRDPRARRREAERREELDARVCVWEGCSASLAGKHHKRLYCDFHQHEARLRKTREWHRSRARERQAAAA